MFVKKTTYILEKTWAETLDKKCRLLVLENKALKNQLSDMQNQIKTLEALNKTQERLLLDVKKKRDAKRLKAKQQKRVNGRFA